MKILCELVRRPMEAAPCDHCGRAVDVGRNLFVVLSTGGAYCSTKCAKLGERKCKTAVVYYDAAGAPCGPWGHAREWVPIPALAVVGGSTDGRP